MIIAGIDPGLGITGYGVIESSNGEFGLLEAGVIRSGRKMDLAEKLVNLYDSLCNIFSEYNPESVSIEEVYSHYNHPRTAVVMGHARGVIVLAAAKKNISINQYSATRIKKAATGNGRASKMQVQQMIQRIFNIDTASYPDDVSDALAAALCHAYLIQHC